MTNVEQLTKFFIENKSRLINKVSHRVFDSQDAEDVVMASFVKAIDYIDSYDPKKKLSPWFNTILNNTIKDYRRKFLQEKAGAMHFGNHPFEEDDFPVEDPGLNIDWGQIDNIKSEIDSKTGGTKEVLRLYFLYNYQPSDITHLVTLDNKSVRTIIHRFKQEMREKYSNT